MATIKLSAKRKGKIRVIEQLAPTVESLLGELTPILEKRIKSYHTMFQLPLIAELWEEMLHRSFKELGFSTTWLPNRSHKIGEDMRIQDIPNSRISCKSGQFLNSRALGTECVKFNGSRSMRFDTLEEKIDHFSQSHDDYYFLLAKKKSFDGTYKLLVFKSSICKVNKLEWTLSSSGKTWGGTGEFTAIIGKSMSAQLWTTLPLNLITHIYDIDGNLES